MLSATYQSSSILIYFRIRLVIHHSGLSTILSSCLHVIFIQPVSILSQPLAEQEISRLFSSASSRYINVRLPPPENFIF